MKALESLTITGQYYIEGEVIIETACDDHDHYKRLPDVINYVGTHCRKTGWNSDRKRACYKSKTLDYSGFFSTC